MPRSYPNTHVSHGRAVGFSLTKRANEPTYFLYFRGPTGQRLERDTNQTGMEKAKLAAHAIIDAEYQPVDANPEKVTWDEAVKRLKRRLKTTGKRDTTAGQYLKLVRFIRAAYPDTDGPTDVSPGMAQSWVDVFTSQPGRGGKPKSAHYVAGIVNGMSALWAKWFVKELEICPDSPWKNVSPPKTDKLQIKYVTDEQREHFLNWLAKRFGSWELPRIFILVKEHTGCRLADICSLRSDQIGNGRLRFDAGQTKGRKARNVPLPSELFDKLDVVKGKQYLWESHPEGLRSALSAKGHPIHRLDPVFSPKRLYTWVTSLFTDYNRDNPNWPKITSHQFRKRAFTRSYLAGIPLDQAAVAYGCGVDTIKKHYLGVDEQEITDTVFARMTPPPNEPAQQSTDPEATSEPQK